MREEFASGFQLYFEENDEWLEISGDFMNGYEELIEDNLRDLEEDFERWWFFE